MASSNESPFTKNKTDIRAVQSIQYFRMWCGVVFDYVTLFIVNADNALGIKIFNFLKKYFLRSFL
jgi:hypothetical protein